MIKIGFDVMGSDKGPEVAVEAAMKFLENHEDLILYFYGDESKIKRAINKQKSPVKDFHYEIVPTTEVIDMNGTILDIRRKKDASLVRVLEDLKAKKLDAMLTGGPSAPFIAGAQLLVGNIVGIKRSGFMPTIPSIVEDKTLLLIDAGANLVNSAEELLMFAKMASIYAKNIKDIRRPKVGLLNVGTEEKKGQDFHKEAYQLLSKDEEINFVGNIEPRSIVAGEIDIMVTDGFTGNIALKTAEGVAKSLMLAIKNEITKTGFRKLLALGLKPAFKDLAAKFDYKNHAGAILLGIDGIVFKSHGSSDVRSFTATLRMTYDAVKNDVLKKIKNDIERLDNGRNL
jgi:glycerol-3-phosphate acyltransferase PlsX